TRGNKGKRKCRAGRTARIRRRRHAQRSILKKGSGLCRQKCELIRQGQHIEKPGAAADGHFPIAKWVPSKTYPWLEIPLCGIVEKRIAEVRRSVGKVPQIRELAMNFRRHGCHLVTQTQIDRQVRFPTPVILDIAAKDGLTKIARRQGTDDSSGEFGWSICQKILQIAKSPNPIWVAKSCGLKQH